MSVVQDDDVVECISANSADDPLAVGVLPGTLGCNFNLFDIEVLNPVPQYATVDRVPIPQQVARRGIPGKGFHDLLGCSLRCRVFSHIEMHDTPLLVDQNDEYEQDSASHGWHGEKIAGDDILNMIG